MTMKISMTSNGRNDLNGFIDAINNSDDLNELAGNLNDLCEYLDDREEDTMEVLEGCGLDSIPEGLEDADGESVWYRTVENYRREAEEILTRIEQRMQETMNLREDPQNEYDEFWWDHWEDAVKDLGYSRIIDDEEVRAGDEVYYWIEDQGVSGIDGIALKVDEFVRKLTENELIEEGQ